MRRNSKERQLQIACVNWFRMQYPKYVIFAIPNGGKRSKVEAANLKKEGTTSGVADVQILIPNKTFFVEFKAPTTEYMNPKTMRVNKKAGGKQSESQKWFEDKCKELNHKYYLVDNLDDFIKIVQLEVDSTS